MVAHCIYPDIDDKISTVSTKILTGLLRNELGFKGVITTDSMIMGALIDKYGVGESCAMALEAGADIILMKAENQWRGEMFHTINKWVEDGRISKEAAGKAVLIAKDKGNNLPLDKGKKTLLINQLNTVKTPNDRFDHPSLFTTILEKGWSSLHSYETSFGFENEKEEKAVVSFGHDVLCFRLGAK